MEKRLIPVNIFDTATMEEWLSQMAEEGFILDSFSGRKAKFKDECCQKTTYRLIPKEDQDEVVSREIRERFEEEGWNFVAVFQRTFYVFSNTDEYPKPVPISREDEQRLYVELKKKKRNSILLSVGAAIFLVMLQLWRFEAYIIGEEAYSGYAFIIAMIVNTMQGIQEYRSYVLIKRKLESINSGVEEDSPYIPTTKWIRTETVLNILAFAILFIPIGTALYETYNYDAVDASQINLPFSYVSLEEIETAEPDMEYQHQGEYIETKTSFLAPVQYEIKQYGITNVDLNGEGQAYDAELRLTYIELRYEVLSNRVLHSMMRFDDTTELEKDGLDQVWVEEDTNLTIIYLQKDNKILEIMYWGDVDILPYIDDFSDIVQPKDLAKSA